jgi:glyoxylase-like metal-dependent hydrolase (beta-lactamase superfamily II)
MDRRPREPAPGIFRFVLRLPFPGLDRVNAYLLTDDASSTLVDCGIYNPHPAGDHGWMELRSALEGAGRRVADVRRLVVTHPHIDHYGMAGRVVDETDCELWMHELATEELDIYRDPSRAVHDIREMLADHGLDTEELDDVTAFEDLRPFVVRVVDADHRLSGGESFDAGGRTWSVLHTPGHSRSHICLWSAGDGMLVSGDHLLPTITPHIDFRRGSDDDPLGDFLASLKRVEDLDPALVLPGHGRPFNEGAERARVIARHHDRRLGSILQVIRRSPHSAEEITDEVFGGTLLNFQRRLALGEALAHLAYLRKRGEVERIEDDGTYKYIKTSRHHSGGDPP